MERFADLGALIWLGESREFDSPLCRGLEVARQGRDIFVEEPGELSGAFGFNSALSLPVLVDRLVPMLGAALGGDPATPVTP